MNDSLQESPSDTIIVTPRIQAGLSDARFDGTSYMQVANYPFTTYPMTFEVWVKRDSSGGTGTPTIIDKNIYSLRFNGTGILQKINFAASGGTLLSKSVLQAGLWYHIAAVDSGSAGNYVLKLYINGVLDTSVTVPGPNVGANPSLVFGRDAASVQNFFSGQIDELKIWKVARSAAQISSTFGNPLAPADTVGLVGYWRFDEQINNQTLDASSYKSNATLNGTASIQNQPSSVFPVAPQNLSSTLSLQTAGIILKWVKSSSSNVKSYNVYRNQSLVQNVSAATTSYNDNPTQGMQYYYTLSAVDSNSYEGVQTPPTSIYDQTTPILDTVKSFRGDKKATLIWHPVNLQSLRRYWIYVDSIGLNNFGLKDSSSTGKNPNDTVRVMTALTDYKTYRFKVAAVDTNGVVSSLSNAFTVVPVDSIPPKIQINSVRAGNGSVNISWSKDRPATNIQLYRIYRGTSATSWLLDYFDTNLNDTTRTYSTLANNTTYYFRIVAVNDSLQESPSDTIIVTPRVQAGLSDARFDGTSYMQVANYPFTTYPMTFEVWVKRDSSGGTGTPTIIDKNIYSLRFNGTGILQKINFVASGWTLSSKSVLQAGLWYHIAAVDSSSVLKLYINGVLDTSVTVSGPDFGANPSLVFGRDAAIAQNFFGGQIDELKIWKVARSASQISSTFGNPLAPADTVGLVGYWRFDEQINSQTLDASSYKLHATLNGTASIQNQPSSVFPVAPLNLSSTLSLQPAGIILRWVKSSSSNVKSYNVYRNQSSLATPTIPAATTSYNDTTASSGLQYYYTLSAVDSNSYEGVQTPPTSIYDQTTPILDTVKSFRGDKKATLMWHPVNLQSLRRYWIYVDSIGLNNFGLKDSSLTGKNPNDTVRVMTALTDYKTYRFKVAAVDTNGVVSSLSNAFTVVPVDSIPPKIQINSVRAGNGRVYINWSKDRPATNIQFYRIYSGTSATSTIETDSTLSSNPNDTTRTYLTLTNNTTYYYRIVAVNDSLRESPSDTIIVTPRVQAGLNDARFDGTSYMQVANYPFTTYPMTFEVWVKRDSGGTGTPTILDKNIYSLQFNGTGILQKINFVASGWTLSSKSVLQAGLWYHIAAVDSSSVLKLYINGILDTSTTSIYSDFVYPIHHSYLAGMPALQ